MRFPRFQRLSRTDNSDLCVTQIPNRTFAKPYVSTPFRSHAQSVPERSSWKLWQRFRC